MFKLHSQLQKDCHLIGQFKLCHLLLMQDANYPWFILVPARENITEIYQLSVEDQRQLLTESSYLSEQLMSAFNGDKMNVAALGNVVSQLHVHHVVRYKTDVAWPAPVWGKTHAKKYDDKVLQEIRQTLRNILREDITFADN